MRSSTEIGCAWTLVTAPVQEPISLADAKAQARITDDHSNDLLRSYIQAAREEAERQMGRGLYTQTWKMLLDDWANVIPLPMAGPLQSVTSVKYYDGDGALQTLATSVYDTDLVSEPGRVVLKPGQSWPSTQSEKRNGRIEITYVVGYATVSSIPERWKQGIKLWVTYLDLDRDGMEEGASRARVSAENCWNDRVEWIPPVWGC